jgi:hypothetical protein
MNSKSWQDGLFHGTKWRNSRSNTRTLIIFSPFCSVKKSVLSRIWIHLSVFPNKLYINIKPIVQAWDRRGRMVVGFTTTYVISAYHQWCYEFKSRSGGGIKILTGRTFSRNKMASNLSVFSSLISNYSFDNNFCEKIIIYLESL